MKPLHADVAHDERSAPAADDRTEEREMQAYAAAESEREALGIRFVSVLRSWPTTALGAVAVAAYLRRPA